MDEADTVFDEPLTGLSQQDWKTRFEEVVSEYGTFFQIDDKHFSALLARGSTLLVTFESVAGIRTLSAKDQPFGWTMAKSLNWSHLLLASEGDTWFRSSKLYTYVDNLIDEGVFDAFETVIFYGAGPCGYAAAAYSVAAPGAKVVMVQPQATLDPRVTEWDDRFTDHRRTDFTSRFGYAPDMIDAAQKAYVIYDPLQTHDAMHSALFTRSNVTKLRMRYFGGTLQSELIGMNMLAPILEKAADGSLDYAEFSKLFRRRRGNRRYLRSFLWRLTQQDRIPLARMVARNTSQRIGGPFFAQWLKDHPVDAGND